MATRDHGLCGGLIEFGAGGGAPSPLPKLCTALQHTVHGVAQPRTEQRDAPPVVAAEVAGTGMTVDERSSHHRR
ncbi:MAG: hypothetical protein DRI90_06905 [Deltaproteobacteria bacterium]|nr:MAG: hypothetical protein DRI90_06905 [Deltaproteobacteria bacterium]